MRYFEFVEYFGVLHENGMVTEPRSAHSKPVSIAEEFDDEEKEDVSAEIMMESENVVEKEQVTNVLEVQNVASVDAVANRDQSISIATNDKIIKLSQT